MTEDFRFQASYKLDGVPGNPLVNVRADDDEDFEINLKAARDLADLIRETGTALMGVTEAQAVATIQRSMPGSQVVQNADTFTFPQPHGTGGDNEREAALRAKGFVADKYHSGPGQGGWWHPTKFGQAPSCQCSGDKPNHGKLALKVGRKRDGGELTGWFCVNTFNRSKAAGCAAVFSGQFPEV